MKQDETAAVCSWTRWADSDGGEFEFFRYASSTTPTRKVLEVELEAPCKCSCLPSLTDLQPRASSTPILHPHSRRCAANAAVEWLEVWTTLHWPCFMHDSSCNAVSSCLLCIRAFLNLVTSHVTTHFREPAVWPFNPILAAMLERSATVPCSQSHPPAGKEGASALFVRMG